MKLDLFKRQWVDIVFEGRNLSYGAYELRTTNNKTTYRALLIGGLFFALAVSAPLIISLIPDSVEEENNDIKIVTAKLPPKKKEEEVLKNAPPPPPPPPRVDQVKFVKPVVAKAEDVTEEPPKVTELENKKIGDQNLKGNDDAPLQVEQVYGDGPATAAVVEEDNSVYSSNAIEIPATYPGGNDKFRDYVYNNFRMPEDDGFEGGKIYVSFTVEKDGSISDIKVRDIGFGTEKETIRVLKSLKQKWNPGMNNGKPARMNFSMPINLVINQ